MILTELLGDNVNVYGQYGDHKVIVKVSPYDVPETVSTLRVAMLTPLVMNIYYFCDPDGKSAYVQDENAVPVDDRTPYLGRFCFRDMICTDCAVATGFFYGLPERSIEEIEISNVTFTFRKNAKKGHPTMMFDAGDSCETLIGSVGWRGHRGLCVRFQGIGFNGLLCCFAPPSSVSSYPMTSAYGGVGVLAGEIVTFATIIRWSRCCFGCMGFNYWIYINLYKEHGMKKKYVQVGTGGRARMYYTAIATTYRDSCELCAICDVSQTRMDFTNQALVEEFGYNPVKTYHYTEFDAMIAEQKPDCVIVTSVDRTHHTYIMRAMELGCDVITEKPMTIDEKKAQAIINMAKKTGRKVRVTFNYRYAPYNTKIRELIEKDTIGEVFSVHFEWLLDTVHGADYYRRWHRNKSNSGGLLVHKSTHHFDLVNYWLGAVPKTVFALGERNFYGIENAERRGVKDFYYRCHGSAAAKNDPFAIDLAGNAQLKGLYLDAEADSGYVRDLSVFGDGISIEDTMGVTVQYDTKAILTYSLNSYMPWEGFVVSLNGSKGRIEYKVTEKVYINAGGEAENEGAAQSHQIVVYPLFSESYVAEDVNSGEGGHGGGDPVLLDSLFGNPGPDPFKREADHIQGAMSILTGIAANKSIASGMPIKIDDLIRF